VELRGQPVHPVWRRYRDFFYVENMHGYDWEALRLQYRPLLEHVKHRSDLNYIIAEMIGELTVQHAYIAGGDWMTPPRPACRAARRTLQAGAAHRPLPHHEGFRGTQRGVDLPITPDRGGRGGRRRRLHPRHRRRRAACR
jgi:hypothetical protein